MLSPTSKIFFAILFFLLQIGSYANATASSSSGAKLSEVPKPRFFTNKNSFPFGGKHLSSVNNTCISTPIPGAPDSFPYLLDCSGVMWTEAFHEMHAKISQEYAYSEWRGVNWQALYNTFAPMVAYAENSQNEAAYYQALRGYFTSIHDAHIRIVPTDMPSAEFIANELSTHVGGSYGLIITKTNNGKFVASYLLPNGSAIRAGIKLGDEVMYWNNIPIMQAIENTPLTWSDEFESAYSSFSPATLAGLQYEKTRLLTRDFIGGRVTITVLDSSTGKQTTATLEAVDDQMQTLNLTNLYAGFDPTHYVTYKILPSGFGYLKISAEDEKSTAYNDVQAAVTFFVNSHLPGIVIDLRGNEGGDDQLAASMAGFFYSGKKKFYESATYFNRNTGQYEPLPGDAPIYVVPSAPTYHGQVVILTDVGTVSSGEGIPMALKGQANVHILSFDPNTEGSFGMDGPLIIMPGSYPSGNYRTTEKHYGIIYPIGRSLNQSGEIQVDANALLQGGVTRDIKIPMNTSTAIATYTNGEDTALTFAVNCLQNQCWATQPAAPTTNGSHQNNFPLGVVAGVAAGVAAIAGGTYLLH